MDKALGIDEEGSWPSAISGQRSTSPEPGEVISDEKPLTPSRLSLPGANVSHRGSEEAPPCEIAADTLASHSELHIKKMHN